MTNDELLKVYSYNKTNMRNTLLELNGLKETISQINEAEIPSNYEYRTEIGYPFKRKNLNEVIKRKFVNKNNRIAPEHAQKFYLYEYSIIHKKKLKEFGYVIGYELPFFKKRGSGAIDLISYDADNNILNLIELKNCAMGDKKDSNESILRAILEIETYTKFVKEIIKKENGCDRLYKDIIKELKKLYDLDISLEKIKQAKIQKNILIPESIYDKSKKNTKESVYFSEIPKDISIWFIKTADTNFDTNRVIKETANNDKIEFEIWKCNK